MAENPNVEKVRVVQQYEHRCERLKETLNYWVREYQQTRDNNSREVSALIQWALHMTESELELLQVGLQFGEKPSPADVKSEGE
jgi:hypothetical protein